MEILWRTHRIFLGLSYQSPKNKENMKKEKILPIISAFCVVVLSLLVFNALYVGKSIWETTILEDIRNFLAVGVLVIMWLFISIIVEGFNKRS